MITDLQQNVKIEIMKLLMHQNIPYVFFNLLNYYKNHFKNQKITVELLSSPTRFKIKHKRSYFVIL